MLQQTDVASTTGALQQQAACIVPSVSFGVSVMSDESSLCFVTLQIDIQDYSLVQAIRSCVVDGTTLLALGNEQGLQVCLKHADTGRGVFRSLSTELLHPHSSSGFRNQDACVMLNSTSTCSVTGQLAGSHRCGCN